MNKIRHHIKVVAVTLINFSIIFKIYLIEISSKYSISNKTLYLRFFLYRNYNWLRLNKVLQRKYAYN